MDSKTMNCLGSFATGGGPVCIGNLAYAKLWRGIQGDYQNMLNHFKKTNARLLAHSINNDHQFIFLSMERDLFTIYRSANLFIVQNVLYKNDSIDLNSIARQISACIDRSQVVVSLCLDRFIAIFDSSLSGKDIGLDSVGSECSYDADPDAIPDTTVLGIVEGIWDVYPAGLRTDEFRLEGAAFILRTGKGVGSLFS